MSNKISSKSLAVKYRPKTFEDVVEQSVVTDILKNIAANSDNLTLRNFLLIGSAGTGKAQPLYSKVLTPEGFVNMSDVEVGTKVVTASGNLGSVSQIFPQGKRDIYEIKLNDDSTIRVADNHLNLVWLYIGCPDPWVLETTSLVDLFSKRTNNEFYIHSVVGNKQEWRKIVNIKYIGKEECQCIMIDHPDHTYISDNFIPTHNTTCARILANELNHGEGEPIEIDAASNNGVDAMRGIVDQAKTYPIVGKYKVFILDECHALSANSWQILLKILEEAPAASVFMLATTNPEKIPETILSRVMTFQLSKISLSGIFNRLKYVLDKEIESGRDIKYEDDAVNFIAKLGNGGMRDSLTLLDTALSYSNNITMENVEKSLNLPNYNDYFSLLQSIAKKDNKSIIETISSVYNSGVNFVKWFEGFHSFVINIVKYINIQDINMTMIPSTYLDKISKYGPAHCTICLKLSNILVKLIHELKSTNYQQEMAITYLCSAKKG